MSLLASAGGSFSQPFAGVQGTQQLKHLGRDAQGLFIRLSRLGGRRLHGFARGRESDAKPATRGIALDGGTERLCRAGELRGGGRDGRRRILLRVRQRLPGQKRLNRRQLFRRRLTKLQPQPGSESFLHPLPRNTPGRMLRATETTHTAAPALACGVPCSDPGSGTLGLQAYRSDPALMKLTAGDVPNAPLRNRKCGMKLSP
jgi:hypothetical protein